MTELTIGEVEEIIGVKAHVLRYWEQEFPMLQPKRDKAGRHIFSERDIHILFRLKHLLHERRYTVEGARRQMFAELSGVRQGVHAQISLLRSELIALRRAIQTLGQKLDKRTCCPYPSTRSVAN
ncbi:MAG: MerR family transcriptional regulator [Treponema sp.]|jgi:DNA-binding transcriptional MerR regulator|nr:MerR family transcriptional regulator [Treponema sp.]